MSNLSRKAGPSVITDRELLLFGAWTAMCLGICEVALLGVARFGFGRYTHINPQNVWMTPLWYLVAGLLASGLVLAVWRRKGHARTVAAIFAPAWLGAVGVLLLLSRVHKLAVILLAAGIALQYALIVVHQPLVRQIARALRVVPAALAILLFTGLNGARVVHEHVGLSHVSGQERMPNVLLIILDTVRGASMGLYGSDRNTTPRLTEFGRHGVVFDNAFTTSSWTLPSHASMFTGRAPHELSADWRSPLDDRHQTLAEVFTRHGYRTGAFVANTFYASRESGLARGFLHYEGYPVLSLGWALTASSIARALINEHGFRRALGIDNEPGRRTADDVSTQFLEWLAEDDERPFFTFLNYFDAHAPYLPPPPFDTLFGPLLPGRDPSMKEGRRFNPLELQAEIDAYDGSIAYLDNRLGNLLDTLQGRGFLDNTLIVVTSDHGEEFGTHGLFTHGNSLYDDVLRVPLLMILPGVIPEGLRVERWVSLEDLPATILDVVGMEESFAGRSMVRLWAGDMTAEVDTLVAAVSYARGRPAGYPVSEGDLRAAMAEPYRYIVNGDGSDELYDVVNDRVEKHNLATTAQAQRTRHALRRYLERLFDTAL